MEWLYAALGRLTGLLAQPIDSVFPRTTFELASSIAIAVALGAIGLLAARRLRR